MSKKRKWQLAAWACSVIVAMHIAGIYQWLYTDMLPWSSKPPQDVRIFAYSLVTMMFVGLALLCADTANSTRDDEDD